MAIFDLIERQDEMQSYLYKHFLWIEQWHTLDHIGNLNWKSIPFTPENINQIPEEAGIYSFVINPRFTNHPQRYLGYIGKTERTLRKRYDEYLKEETNIKGRPKVLRLLNKCRGHIDFVYVVVPDNILSLESQLNDGFVPPYNDDFSLKINRIIGAF